MAEYRADVPLQSQRRYGLISPKAVTPSRAMVHLPQLNRNEAAVQGKRGLILPGVETNDGAFAGFLEPQLAVAERITPGRLRICPGELADVGHVVDRADRRDLGDTDGADAHAEGIAL